MPKAIINWKTVFRIPYFPGFTFGLFIIPHSIMRGRLFQERRKNKEESNKLSNNFNKDDSREIR